MRSSRRICGADGVRARSHLRGSRGLMDSGLRSETIHQRLSDAELEITDGYEIEARSTGGGFDLEAFNRAALASHDARAPKPSPGERINP